MTYVYRVRWRRPAWKPGRMNARIYQQRAAAEQLVERLEADGSYGDVVLDEPEVLSAWSRITARTPPPERQATPTPEPVDVTASVW